MSYTDSDYASAVWTTTPRTLVSGSAGSPTTRAQVFAAAVWAYSPRTLHSLPVDFLSAVKAFFLASAAASSIPGGLFYKVAGKRASLPYCVWEEVSAPLKLATSHSQVRRTRLRFKIYHDDTGAASAAGNVLEDAFKKQTLTFSDGITGPFWIGDRGHRDESMAQSNAGLQGWYFLIEFTVDVRRGA